MGSFESEQGHSAGLDEIFQLKRARRFARGAAHARGTWKIMIWKTPALCATLPPN
jgi:hypothetical protein